MAPETTSPLLIAVEVTIWLIPSLLALLLAIRTPGAERRPWVFIALACCVFAVDELVDILGRGHRLAQRMALAIDPNGMRGDTLIWRILGLGLAAAIGLAAMLYLFRGGRSAGSGGVPRWVAFAGVCVIGAYVIFRLVPRLGPFASGPGGWAIQAVAWCLMVGGGVMEFDRRRDADD